MPSVTVKKEPEEISSTSQQEQTHQIHIQQPQTIAVSVAPTHSIETSSTIHHDSSDGSTSLQIAQVQNLPTTHQFLNQVIYKIT